MRFGVKGQDIYLFENSKDEPSFYGLHFAKRHAVLFLISFFVGFFDIVSCRAKSGPHRRKMVMR